MSCSTCDANRDPAVNQRLHAALRELFLTRSAAEWEDDRQPGRRCHRLRPHRRGVAPHDRTRRSIGAVVRLGRPRAWPDLDGWAACAPRRQRPAHRSGPRHLPDADRDAIMAELEGLPDARDRCTGGLSPDLLARRCRA